MANVQKRFGEGGLDFDSSLKTVGINDYTFAANIDNSVSSAQNFNIVSNLKGNTLISYPLPIGDNRTLGSYEDKKNSTLIAFIWNSNNDHLILRYYIQKNRIELILKNSLLNFNPDFLITGINVVNGGDDKTLLLWTDGFNPPRRLNIDKANRTDKKLKFIIYFDLPENHTFTNGDSFSFSFTENGVAHNAFNFFTFLGFSKTGADKNDILLLGINEFVTQFNTATYDGSHNLNTKFKATACGYQVEVEALVKDIYNVYMTSSTNTPFQIVYENIYNDNFVPEFLDACKYPPHCEPKVTYKTDKSRKINLVKERVFQFAAAYIYDDYDQSALSPDSIIPLYDSGCANDTNDTLNNYIEIDFTDPRLQTAESLNIINKIELFVREHNIGKWRHITTLESNQFGILRNIYRFYNDEIYPEIAETRAIKLFDTVPLKARAQENFDDRMGYGGLTEGYDPECIDAEVDIAYKDSVKINTYNISGKIFIRNVYRSNGSGYDLHQPIHNLGQGAVWGGFANAFRGHEATVGTAYRQTLELEGFVIYLAGTNHYAISRQIFGNNPQIQDSNGVYDSSTVANRNLIRDEITGSSGHGSGEAPDTRVWSEFTIKNVPNGRYVLRIASHFTTLDELNSSDRIYQRSSTNVIEVGGMQGYEIEVVVNNGDITIGTTAIVDLTDAGTFDRVEGLCGYVTDKDSLLPPVTQADYLGDTRIHLSKIRFNISVPVSFDYNNQVNSSTVMQKWNNTIPVMYADHNGYFFFVVELPVIIGTTSFQDFYSLGNPISPMVIDYFTLAAFTPVNSSETKIVIARNTNGDVSNYSRTELIGKITSNGTTGIEGVGAVSTRGGISVSDDSGDFQIDIYGDTRFYDDSGGVTRKRADRVDYVLGDGCQATFVPDHEDYDVEPIGNALGEYNHINKFYNLITVIAAITSSSSNSFFKRGFDGQFGIVYFDLENRQTTTLTAENLKKHILFYTETNERGIQEKKGRPELSWQVRNVPPEWATHYQWVRTYNNQMNFYLQFAAKFVTYVDEADATATFSTAAFAQISIDGLTIYKKQHPNSTLAYTWERGDRLRLIKNSAGNFYPEYFDFEIVKQVGLYIYIEKSFKAGELKEGVFFEIYTPKLQVENQIYWEFGECFEVDTDNNGKKFHKGLTQDQDPNDPANVPAKGIFRTGDVYYRTREIPLNAGNGSLITTVDDQSISDFYISKDQSIGRPQVQDKTVGRIVTPGLIRISNRYIPGSKLNGLSSFEPLNAIESDRRFGFINIMALLNEGLLVCICEHKVQPYYVGKALLRDVADTKLIAIAQDILNKGNSLQGDYGTQNPESFAKINDSCYFWDRFQGVLLRYSTNGLFPISDYKMKSYFIDKSNAFKDIPDVMVRAYGTYELKRSQYILSFKDVRLRGNDVHIPSETIAFSEPKNRWVTFYDYHPEYFGTIGNHLFSFLDGQLWMHDTNETRNNFYGVQYESQIQLVANQEPSVIKTWEATSVEANNAWAMPVISTPPNSTYKLGMLSRLKKTKFVKREGFLYSQFDNDMLSTGFATQLEALINGQKLKGEILVVTLTNDETVHSELFSVNFLTVESNRNPETK